MTMITLGAPSSTGRSLGLMGQEERKARLPLGEAAETNAAA